jgi:hypothetical protein
MKQLWRFLLILVVLPFSFTQSSFAQDASGQNASAQNAGAAKSIRKQITFKQITFEVQNGEYYRHRGHEPAGNSF